MTVTGNGALELVNVTAGYGQTTVLRDVTLVAPGARVTALIGANGAGKTTLLGVAAGLVRATSGRVEVDGHDVTRRPPHARVAKGICFVPEGRAIFPSLTVRENLELHDRGAMADSIERAVEAFPRLGQRLQQIAGTMSGGEQQMLALSRAYVSGARYVLLDEVSMGLAPNIVAEIFDFMRKLAADGVGLLVVEQYVQHVLEIADLVYVLRKGQVAFAGQPAEVDSERLAEEYLGVGA